MLGVGGNEDEGRRRGQGIELAGQLHAVGAGHVNVDQGRVKALAHQQIHRIRRVGGFGGQFGAGVAAVAQQAAHARARQGFVIHDENLQGLFGLSGFWLAGFGLASFWRGGFGLAGFGLGGFVHGRCRRWPFQ